MGLQKLNLKIFANLMVGLFFLIAAGVVFADPPGRVARISYISGAVSFVPAGESDWVEAKANRPLTTGDRVWADKNAKVELQLGAADVRLGQNTSVTLLNLNDKTAQFQLSTGTMDVRVWRLRSGQIYEVDTPNLAFSIHKVGSYRIDVDANGKTTLVSINKGQGSVYGEKAGYQLTEGQSCSFSGTNLQGYQCSPIAAADDFSNWVSLRDHRAQTSKSARYVSHDMIGREDLDKYGEWHHVGHYGNAWMPHDMPVGWAPYSTGHWAWINPWGWTWIDDTPWGFAPYHYGRWVYYEDHWYWVPGPPVETPVYAPAFVAFFGNGFEAGIGWFPLGPDEPYIPAYQVSPTYFNYINTSNTIININFISNLYTHRHFVFAYHNQHIPGAVTVIPRNVFQKSQPVAKHRILVTPAMIKTAKIVQTAKVVPDRASIIGLSEKTVIKPPKAVIAMPVVVKTHPPAPPVPFAVMQKKLADNPGQPLPPHEINSLRPAKPVVTPEIKVITPPTKPLAPIPTNHVVKPIKPDIKPLTPTKPILGPSTGPKVKPIPDHELKPPHELKPVTPPNGLKPPHELRPVTPPPHELKPVTPPNGLKPPHELRPVTPPPHELKPVTPPNGLKPPHELRPVTPPNELRPPHELRPVTPPNELRPPHEFRPVTPPNELRPPHELRPTQPQHEFRPAPPPQQEFRPERPRPDEFRPAPQPQHEFRPAPPPQQEFRPERPRPDEFRPAPPQQHEFRPAPPPPPQQHEQHEFRPAPQQRSEVRPHAEQKPVASPNEHDKNHKQDKDHKDDKDHQQDR